jgi:flagellar hook-associated protein 3 FlgL
MRITNNITNNIALQSQLRSSQKLNDATQVASTGERVNAPSDDPVAWSAAVSHDARIKRMERRTQTGERAAGDFDLAENALASAGDIMSQVQAIAVQASNDPLTAAQRAALGLQVSGLRDQIIGLANSRGASGFLFGGTRTDIEPFDPLGAFLGNDVPTNIEISDGVTARSNASGARAFTAAGGRDIFTDLQTLSTALAANNMPAIRTAVGDIAAGHLQLVNGRVETGLRGEQIRSAAEVTGNALLATRIARGNETGADLPSAISALSNARASYERSIAVTREILQVSAVQR